MTSIINFDLFMRCCIFCYGCVFAFVVLDLVFKYLVKRLAGKNASEITYFLLNGTYNLTSVNPC